MRKTEDLRSRAYDQSPVMSYGTYYAKRDWGAVPVEEDGSAHFRVPALREIYFQVLDAEGLDDDTGVAIVLIDEPQMAELNETHMGKEGPTDVLSFPIETARPGLPPTRVSGGPPIELGDVFIAPSIVRRNAEQQGVHFENELALMIVHGLLHLLGWDHEDEADAIRMERRERELLALTERRDLISFSIGLPAPELMPLDTIGQLTDTILREAGPTLIAFTAGAQDRELPAGIVRRQDD